ncbi:sensor histidine kinase [Spirosoma montaniterrae]|uniref:histidine kinase n=1 Tax=Spirosoma montaniterrae TaxID=1178516 RepID=A0A1P9WU43_9BACT|nr:HAMP domain-containing sensor histidine kinase [Spirosoma montaniterrae]AQG78860.1 histidine kinase [Spirosoma montaniterrae]
MANRTTALPFIVAALLLTIASAVLLFIDWSPLSGTTLGISPTTRSWALVLLTIASQITLGFLIWRILLQPRSAVIHTEVLHSLVHEFQTPIAAIRMAADILDSPIARNQPERSDKYIRIIREESERLQHQVETMLTLARAERNTLILNNEPVSVYQLLSSVAERHADYLQLCLPATNAHFLADRLHLTNVLHNLLDNAVKYSPTEPIITLRAEETAGGLLIAVRDQGVGIPAQFIGQIFQPFFRVHDRNQPSVKGFGLGLSYVHRIVLAHNWTIDVQSELGKGSEFTIRIPQTALLPEVDKSSVSRSK